MPPRTRSQSLGAPKYLPYEAQHVLLNTVLRLLEESCFDFAKTWFSSDPRVREWTTPAQVEISKWRDLLGAARIPYEALDGNVQTPLRVLLQEATYIRNNAVHRSQLLVEDILKLLISSIQLARMLRDQTRCTRIEGIRHRLIYELNARDDNRARAKAGYHGALDDIERRREPILKTLDKLRDEEGDAVTLFEENSALYDNMLQSSMIKFINQVIHTGEEVARIAPIAVPAPRPLPIVNPIVNSSAATAGKSEIRQERDGDDVQIISKSDFEGSTSGCRKLRKNAAQDVAPDSKDQEMFFKSGSVGATPKFVRVMNSGTELDIDSPSRQLELEAKMANSIRELSIDEYEILGNLDAELDNQLVRTMNEARVLVDSVLDQMNSDVRPSVEESLPNFTASGNSDGRNDKQPYRHGTEPCFPGRRVQSSELKMTDRSAAPSPDVKMSGADASNTITADSATENGSTQVGRKEPPRYAVDLSAVEFGKPWKPATNGPVPVTKTVKFEEGLYFGQSAHSALPLPKPQQNSQTTVGFPSKPSTTIVRTEKEVNLSNMPLFRKRKAVSPLSQRTSASCNSITPARFQDMPKNPIFSTGVTSTAVATSSTTSIAGLPKMISFGDVARFTNTMGPNPLPPALFTGVGHMSSWELGKSLEVSDTDVFTSRQGATFEGRRILVGCLSFTPSKAEVEKLFLGYNLTRIDFPEMWIMGAETKSAGCVFVDLATAAQAKLAIQKLGGEEPKIRNCKVSIMLATDPWNAPNASRRIIKAVARNKKKTAHPSGVGKTKRKSEPIGNRTRSYYAAAPEKGMLDGQSSKRQKLMVEAPKDTTGLNGK